MISSAVAVAARLRAVLGGSALQSVEPGLELVIAIAANQQAEDVGQAAGDGRLDRAELRLRVQPGKLEPRALNRPKRARRGRGPGKVLSGRHNRPSEKARFGNNNCLDGRFEAKSAALALPRCCHARKQSRMEASYAVVSTGSLIRWPKAPPGSVIDRRLQTQLRPFNPWARWKSRIRPPHARSNSLVLRPLGVPRFDGLQLYLAGRVHGAERA